MNKKQILCILFEAVFLVVFNAIFFLAGGFEHPISEWIAYGFIHFSYLARAATPFLTHKNIGITVLGLPAYYISSIYFFVSFLVGMFFIILSLPTYTFVLLVFILITGVYAAVLLSVLIADEDTENSLDRNKAEAAYIKNASARVKLLIGQSPDKKTDAEIEKTYDLLHSSPVKTISAVYTLELDINQKVIDLERAVAANDAAAAVAASVEIRKLLAARNAQIKSAN